MTVAQAIYQARWQRAQTAMAAAGLEMLLVGPGADLFYLLGQAGHLSPRLVLLALPASGPPTLLTPELEVPGYAAWHGHLSIASWRDGEDPVARLAAAIGSPPSTVGIGDRLWSVFLLRLQERFPAVRWAAAGPVLRALRMIKDEHELAIMRTASRHTDTVWQRFCQLPVSGLTEAAAARRLTDLLAEYGMSPAFPAIVGAGANGASPHHEPGARQIQPGDALVCDFGGVLDGYCSDITRTAFVGDPPPAFVTVYELVAQAQQAAFAAVRPGQPCAAVDAAARSVIEAGGFGRRFIHRTGHGIGIDIHEEPYIVAGNTLPLQPGMVFSDEPGIYLTDEFGVRIEDLIVVTDDGAERLNHCSRALTVLH